MQSHIDSKAPLCWCKQCGQSWCKSSQMGRQHQGGKCELSNFLQEGDALCSMYEQDAMMCTEDGNIFIWAGATVGGGTRVNWYAASSNKHSGICMAAP